MAEPAVGREVGPLFRGGEHGVPVSPVARGSVARPFGGGDGVGEEREQRSRALSDGRLLPPRRFFPVAAAIRKEGGRISLEHGPRHRALVILGGGIAVALLHGRAAEGGLMETSSAGWQAATRGALLSSVN